MQLQNEVENFQRDGVIVYRDLLPPEQLQQLSQEVARVRAIVAEKIQHMTRPLRTYSDIAERQPGRLDYRCGFTGEIFNEIATPIVKIIQQLSPQIDFHHYWGAIPSQGGSGPTDMHRDVYPILNNLHGQNLSAFDLNLPPYYFTVLIPLVEVTQENGPTEFIKGSHLQAEIDVAQAEISAPTLSIGDVVIFEGRTLHRGSANLTQQERLVAYITFVANWYHDQTFRVNDYLFPELINP